MKALFSSLVLLSLSAAAADCPGQAANWNSCSSIDQSQIPNSPLNPVVERFVAFDANSIRDAFNNSQSCNTTCLETLFRRTQTNPQASVIETQNVLRRRARVNQAKILFKQMQREMRLVIESEDFVSIGRSGSQLPRSDLQLCQVNDMIAAESCASGDQEFNRLLRESLQTELGLAGNSVPELMTSLINSSLEGNRRQEYACPQSRTRVNYRQTLDAFLDMPLTQEMRQVIPLLHERSLVNGFHTAQALRPNEPLAEIAAIELIKRLHPSLNIDVSLGPAAQTRAIDDALPGQLDRIRSLLRHPLMNTLLRRDDGTGTASLSLGNANTVRDYIRNTSNAGFFLYHNGTQARETCHSFRERVQEIYCVSSPYQRLSNDDLAATYNPTNASEQVALMGLACSRGDILTPAASFTGNLLNRFMYGPSGAGLMEYEGASLRRQAQSSEDSSSTIANDGFNNGNVSLFDTSFLGYSQRVCENESGVITSRTRIYDSGTLRGMRSRDSLVVDTPVDIVSVSGLEARPLVSLGDLGLGLPRISPVAALDSVQDSNAPTSSGDSNTSGAAPTNTVSSGAISASPQITPVTMTSPLSASAIPTVSAPAETINAQPAVPAVPSPSLAVAANSPEARRLEQITEQLRTVERQLAEAQERASRELENVEDVEEAPVESNTLETEIPVAPRSPSRGVASVASPRRDRAVPEATPSVAEVTRSNSAAPASASQIQTISTADLPQAIANGIEGLDGAPSEQARGIRGLVQSLPANRRSALSLVRQSNGSLQLVNRQGEEVALDTDLSDIDILSVLSDINNDPSFNGRVEVVEGRFEINVSGRRIVLDPNSIPDLERRAQIALLVNEIAQRRAQITQRIFRSELQRRLALARNQ